MDGLQPPTNENAGVEPGGFSATTTKHYRDANWNSAQAQCARGLARLRLGPANTYELRREEDIYDPPARIFQLRHQYNHHIDLVWTYVTTEANVTHRVGKYVLVSEAAQ